MSGPNDGWIGPRTHLARVGSPVDAASVAAFNEQHNSAAQRVWFAEHVRAWAATQPAVVRPLATELVNGCRWLVRSSNADLVLPLAPKSPALLEPCTQSEYQYAMATRCSESRETREAFLHKSTVDWESSEHFHGHGLHSRHLGLEEGLITQMYAKVYEFPSEAVAAGLAQLQLAQLQLGAPDGGTGAVLLLESLDLRLHPHTLLTCLPSGLDVGGSLLARRCHMLVRLPERVGWDVDASECSSLAAVALVDVGGAVALEQCARLVSMADCQLAEVRGPLNLGKCEALVQLPPKLARVGGFLCLSGCAGLVQLPDPLAVEGRLQLMGCRGLGASLGAGLRAQHIFLEETGITTLPSSTVSSGDIVCGDALTHLPEDLSVVNGRLSFSLSTGSQLRRLPAGLREVRGDLELGSALLTELPAHLHVGGSLSWTGDADRLPPGLRVDGDFTLKGHPRLAELPDDVSVGHGGSLLLEDLANLRRLGGVRGVQGAIVLRGCQRLAELPMGLQAKKTLDVSFCVSLAAIPREVAANCGHIVHEGCPGLQWPRLLDWTDAEDPARSLSAVLHIVLDFVDPVMVRGRCALVSRAWKLAAYAKSPPWALRGCRRDWVRRVITELSARSDAAVGGCHVEPSAEWRCSPDVRVEKAWMPAARWGGGEVTVRVEAVVSAQALFLRAANMGARDLGAAGAAGELKAGDEVALGPVDFGSAQLREASSAAATVESVEEGGGSVRLLATFTFDEDPCMSDWEHCTVVSPKHQAAWEETQNQPVKEGVCFADGDVPAQLLQRLQSGIDFLAASQPPDYHPNSRGIVRDHVHPALYPFIYSASPFAPSVDLGAPPALPPPALPPPALQPPALQPPALPPRRATATPFRNADRWGRPYEASEYQWLPTYFDYDGAGRVTVRGRINNLPSPPHEPLCSALADLFEQFLPYIDVAQAYAEGVDFSGDRLHRADEVLLKLPAPPRAAAAWQVITKIVDYELQPGQTYDGVWHVEGMSHEHILCTCLYVLDRGANIQGGDLKFKRALTGAERAEALRSFGQDIDSTTRRLLDSEDALVPLGKVATPAGRRIVFPNSHVHRLSELKNTGSAPERRRIVAFFVVDPKARIVSTQECPDQTSTMTREQALQHRLALMQERRLHKQDWNVREVNLCEH